MGTCFSNEPHYSACAGLPRKRGVSWQVLFLFVSAVSLISFPSHAYDVDAGHVPLTSLSIGLYNTCFPSNVTYQSTDARKRLIQGNRGMDKGKWDMYRHLQLSRAEKKGLTGVSVFRLAHRVKNWHFYNPDRADLSRKDTVEQSFIRLWQELREGFSSNSGMSRLLFLGGLIHLVEDVSVPAHSIPVYHGPSAIPALEQEYLKSLVRYMRKARRVRNGQIKDPIDWIGPDENRLAEILLPGPEFCAAVENSRESPEEIRDRLFRTVQELLQTPIPGCVDAAWSDFWTMPEGRDYFGRYNIADGRPMFGEAGTVHSMGGAACTMKELDVRYSEFVLELHRAAIIADLELLRWAEGQPETQAILERQP